MRPLLSIAIISFLLLFAISNTSGSKTDSLRLLYSNAKSDTTKANLLVKIGDVYEFNKPDSALYYYYKAHNKLKGAKKQDHNIQELKGKVLRYISIAYRRTGDFSLANNYLTEALEKYLEIDNKEGIASTYSSFGVLNRNMGNNKAAIEYYQKALRLHREVENISGISACYNNIGIIHDIEENYPMALEYYYNALEHFRTQGNKQWQAVALMNIGSVYLKKEQFDVALEYYDNSMELFVALKNRRGIAQTYNNKALVFVKRNDMENGLKYYQESLDAHYRINDLLGVATTYNNLADLNFKKGNYSESIKYANNGLEVASKINSLSNIVQSYNHLRKAYMALDNHYQASQYADLYISNKDSLHSVEISKAIAELETKYQAERSQLEIERLQNENELKEAELQIKNILLIVVASGLLIAGVLSVIVFYQYNAKKNSNTMLKKRNADIQDKNIEIIKQRNKIENSINYAQSIQTALLPEKSSFADFFEDLFVFEQPSDIVSGDFYWVHAINKDKIIFAVADCTGHGVPGAFMSILGITLLNDIIIKHQEYRPDKVLNQLRTEFITALHQENPNQLHNEGVDISICIYDKSKNELEFAASRSQIWILKKQNHFANKETSNNEMLIFKGDNFPIGISKKAGSFSKQKISLNNDHKVLYLFSDGFYNQINPAIQKRYSSKRFREKILQTSQLTMQEQYHELKREFNNWKGNEAQIDDVTIVGIKLK